MTNEEKHKVMVVAKAFFDDGQIDPEYPFKDVDEQYRELVENLKTGGISWDFVNFVYSSNL